MNLRTALQAITSVAYKEFLHIYRDRRVLILLIILPPVFTLIFGHAFEISEMNDVPAILINRDDSPRALRFVELVSRSNTFRWQTPAVQDGRESDLLGHGVQAALIIPSGWGEGLNNGDLKSLRLYLDGSDTNTAQQLEGSVQKSLGEFQQNELQLMIDGLPDQVRDLARTLPVEVRKQFVSAMEQWPKYIEEKVLYNPKSRFIDYVVPGIIGLILQLLSVTLMASTIARERESGTLAQLMVTSLRRGEVVIGKIVPYLFVSACLILVIILLTGWHFHVRFHQPPVLALICLLFLVCSLGLGLLISAFSRTQTQAIQISVFFLLPVFILSGAFAPLQQLPRAIQIISELFPLTHFCRAFRLVSLYHAPFSYLTLDLVALFFGAVITFVGAALLLKRTEQ